MKKEKLIKVLITISILSLFFYISSIAPMFGIDIFHATSLGLDSKFTLLRLIIRAGGRTLYWNTRLGEFLFYLVAPLPHIVYDIVNTLFFALFFFLVFKYSLDYNSSSKDTMGRAIYLLPLLFFLFLVCEPNLWDDFFWMAGSCNHLWGLCILLLSFLPLRKFFLKSYQLSKIKLLLLCPLLFVAGLVSENIVFVFVLMTFLIIIYKYIKERKIYSWTIISLVFYLLGYAYLLFNPSTLGRYSYFSDQTWGLTTKKNMLSIFINNYNYYLLIILFLITLYLVQSYYINNKKLVVKKSFLYNVIFYVLSYASLIPLLFCPYFFCRAILIISFSSLVLITYLIKELSEHCISSIKIIVFSLAIIGVCCYSYSIQKLYNDYNQYSKQKDEFINIQISQNSSNIMVPLYNKPYERRLLAINQPSLCSDNIIRNKFNISDDVTVTCSYDVTMPQK